MKDILDDGLGYKTKNVKGLKMFKRLSYWQVVVVLVAGVIATIDVESILFTSVFGCLFSLCFWFITFKEGKWFGIYPWLFSGFCVAFISGFSLSPKEAQVPIPILIFIFAFFLFTRRKAFLEQLVQ